ncbi:hypothetical protein [Myceligenerans crystallogenes]|uniref:Uncharacterized protein n=1 Tax=Myceligenerans crystallogenes TaxID=316335 RepID=A0ABN2NJG6_9MICO
MIQLTIHATADTLARVRALRIEPVIEVLGDAEFDLWPVVGQDGFWYQTLHGPARAHEPSDAVARALETDGSA